MTSVSTSRETPRGDRIANNAIASSVNDGITRKTSGIQIDNAARDNYLANLMYCLPITESMSLPESAIIEKMRTLSSLATSTTAESSQNIDATPIPNSSTSSYPKNTNPNLPAQVSKSVLSLRPESTSSSGPTALGDIDNATSTRPAQKHTKANETKSISMPAKDNTSTLGSSRDKNTPELLTRDVSESNETKADSAPHPDRCGCGCVPNTPSLFEMAELRRQHRLRLQKEGKSPY